MPYIGTSPSNGVRRVHTYTATASQTTFTGASSEGVTLSYADTNYIDVFQNGVLLGSADYTSTSGTSVVLAQGASVNDLIVIVVYDVFSVADTVSKTNGGSFDSAVTMSNNLTVSGAFTSQGIDDNADATAITIDSDENVAIGVTSKSSANNGSVTIGHTGITKISAAASGNADELVLIGADASANVGMSIIAKDTNNSQIYFGDEDDTDIGAIIYNHPDNALRFQTNTAEAMRIDNGGKLFIGHTADIGAAGGAKFQLDQSNNNWIHYLENSVTSGNAYGQFIYFAAVAPDNLTARFLQLQDSAAVRLNIYSDGDVYNHDGTFAQFSDERIKDNITDAKSQWNDIKAMRFVNYQRKDDILQYGKEDAKVQLGLIGQELEKISPNLVRQVEPNASDIRHSSELGTLYEKGDDIPEGKQVGDIKEVKDKVKGVAYSILYMKAVKALQEAMTRIETLEAEVKALKGE